MRALWRIHSGRFAGYKHGDRLYDARGRHIGHFEGLIAYSLAGSYLATLFQNEWVGQREEGTRLSREETRPAEKSIEVETQPDREKLERWGLDMKGWVDPNF